MSEIKLNEQKGRIYKEISVKLLCNSNEISTEINGSFSSIFGWYFELNDITLSSLKKTLYNNRNELFKTKSLIVEFHGDGVDNEFYKHIINNGDFESSTYYEFDNCYTIVSDGVTFVFFVR